MDNGTVKVRTSSGVEDCQVVPPRKTSKPKKRETNVQFMKRVMEFSQSGALMQAFIFDAMLKHSDAIANMPFEKFEKQFGPSPFFSAQAWHETAKELQRELKERL